jgi:hypothetical protein
VSAAQIHGGAPERFSLIRFQPLLHNHAPRARCAIVVLGGEREGGGEDAPRRRTGSLRRRRRAGSRGRPDRTAPRSGGGFEFFIFYMNISFSAKIHHLLTI